MCAWSHATTRSSKYPQLLDALKSLPAKRLVLEGLAGFFRLLLIGLMGMPEAFLAALLLRSLNPFYSWLGNAPSRPCRSSFVIDSDLLHIANLLATDM
jgi:hypothetical protein